MCFRISQTEMYPPLKFLPFLLTAAIGSYPESPLEPSVQRGRQQYEMIQSDTKSPIYGTCWSNSLNNLHKGCEQLTEEVQSRLAIAFANCFLIKSGRNPMPCDGSKTVSECLKNADDQSFGAYTAFFTHSQDMCFFLKSHKWRSETGDLIDR
jgi:hypothetical protein